MLASTRLSLAALSAFAAFSNAASIKARADSCGVHGYDKSNAYSYDGSGATATLSACGAACKADTQCKSFGFGGSECLLYAKTVAENVNVDATSPYSFFDVGCLTTTTTSSTTLTTSTVSTTASPSPTSSGLCGQHGYDLGNPSSYNYDNSGANGNLAACSARCLADFKCWGFAFSSTECLLYWVPATGNFYPQANSPYVFYDRTCVAPPATTTSTTSTSSAPPAPTQTFCLQVTGSGVPGKGYYAYTAPTTNGNPALFFTSNAATTQVPELFYIAAPFGTPFLWNLQGQRVEFGYRQGNPAPPTEQPLIWVGPITRGDQQDYQLLNCAAGANSQIQCSAGAGGYQSYSQWAVDDASFATDQRLYFQSATTGTKSQIGLTIVPQSLCPPKAVANP